MNKKGDEKKGIYTIIIIIIVIILLYILYRILQEKIVGGIFSGI